jgi:hypothetical protein
MPVRRAESSEELEKAVKDGVASASDEAAEAKPEAPEAEKDAEKVEKSGKHPAYLTANVTLECDFSLKSGLVGDFSATKIAFE